MKSHLLLIATTGVITTMIAVSLPGSLADVHAAARGSASPRPVAIALGTAKRASPSIKQQPLLPVVDQKDILLKHRERANALLRLLPDSCTSLLDHFYVIYGPTKNRGLAGKGVVIMQGTLPDTEFDAVFVHEALGHFWDTTCLTGNPAQGKSEFKDGSLAVALDDPSVGFYRISWTSEKQRKKNAKPEDFVSGYAFKADPFEDLAESVAYHVLQPDAFRARAAKNAVLKRKLDWINTHFPLQTEIAAGSTWTGKIPWDATKVAYRWIGQSL